MRLHMKPFFLRLPLSGLLLVSFVVFGMVRTMASFVAIGPTFQCSRSFTSSESYVKRPKVADESDVWPSIEQIPMWATQNETPSLPPDGVLLPHNGVWSVSIVNNLPTWETVLARVLWDDETSGTTTHVQPAAAKFAPRGGCDNLCNDNERYTDEISFVVSFSVGKKGLLLIRTEETSWSYRLES